MLDLGSLEKAIASLKTGLERVHNLELVVPDCV